MQGIEFQIVNDSAEASRGLDELAQSLANLKSSLGSSGSSLNTVAKNIGKIRDAVSGLNTAKLTALGDALNALKSQTEGLKISSSIGNQLKEIASAVNSIPDMAQGKLQALADGLQPLSELGKQQLGPFLNQLKKLPEVVTALDSVDLDKFADQMQRLAEAMKPFADEMQKVSSGFAAFPSRIQKLITSTEQYNGTVRKAETGTSRWSRALKTVSFAAVFKGTSSLLAKVINRANEYIESLNLFTVSMGDYAKQAYSYAQTVSEVMGIDPATWMENQGVFNSIITGFGVVEDKAYTMSKNLTQLAYDISSFYNIGIEESMQKVQSGISGELEPLRRLGYDLSVARLQQEAYNLGISKSVSEMTQAEKAQLRYHAMLTQVTQVQGDMARTLDQPANQLRVLKAQVEQAARAFGNLFIPILNAVLPVAIAVASAIREIISAIAALFGIQMADSVDFGDSLSGAAGATGEIADDMDDAASSAKKMKSYLMGFDELNVINPNEGSGSGAGSSGGAGFDIEPIDYDFLGEAVTDRIDAIKAKLEPFVTWVKDHLEEIKDLAIGIGGILLGWSISNAVIKGVERVAEAFKAISGIAGGAGLLAIAGLLADVNRFVDYINDIAENGADLSNVSGAISELIGIAGDISILSGHTGIGGALKIVQGIGEIVSACADIAKTGVNWENMSTAMIGISNVVIGIGLISKNWKVVGTGFAIQGLTTIILELHENWDAIKQGDWSGVDKVTLAIGAIELIGGVVTAISTLSTLASKAASISTAEQALMIITPSVGNIAGSVSALTGKLTTIATNIGLGVGILAEVAAAAIIFVGAIWILGEELQKVAEAWEPVLDNAETVLLAVYEGTTLLVGVGAACYGLGTLGGTAAVNIGIGALILAELGIATGLFLVEIWGIGKGLDEIGQAWQPVIDNGETIATAIGIGTGLLVAVGAATAALGAVTIATGALLPAAILIGVGVLEELGVAFDSLVDNLVKVADKLNNELHPKLSTLNGILPGLKTDMHNFVVFMGDLAGEIGDYTKSMGSITWDNIVGGFQKLFKEDPIGDLADDVDGIYQSVDTLNEKLALANPELELAVQLLTRYADLMSQLQLLTQFPDGNSFDAGTITSGAGESGGLAGSMFVNLQTVGENLVTGFVTGINNNLPMLTEKIAEMKESVELSFTEMCDGTYQTWDTCLTDMGTRFDSFKLLLMESLSDLSIQFQSRWASTWMAVMNVFIYRWNRILDSLQEGVDYAIDALNELIRDANSIAILTGRSYQYLQNITVKKIPVSYMADGGFPDAGQLFIAREAGAELVGSIGRHTAVANNDQIVAAVSGGVRDANDEQNALLREQNELLRAILAKDTSTKLDGKTLLKSTEKAARQRGTVIMAGGVMG